jgi:hypothetical protein
MSSRRKFISDISLKTAAIAITPSFVKSDYELYANPIEHKSKFNMCGYAAPKLSIVRIGFIGLGMRGPGAVERMSHIEGVQIVALCDKYSDRVAKAQDILKKAKLPMAREYSGSEDAWKKMCEDPNIDLIYICTPWSLHTPMALHAMNNGKHAAVEVPAATKLEECWQLVETSEKTKKHCMMLENCCYDFFEMLTLNMTRNGLFGELVHAEGAYIHELRWLNFKNQGGYADLWRLRENATRNGNLYPTHGLGPIAQCLDINRGDKMDHLVSMSTIDFQMKNEVKEVASKDALFVPFIGSPFRGNMNTTIIKTAKGKTMMLQHDVTSTRPYSRIHLLSGTKGIAQKWPSPARIALGESWANDEQMKELEEKYTPPLIKHVGEIAKKIGGHGGMDFIMDWRLIDCLRNGLPLDQDVYDAASWSAVAPISELSVAKKSKAIDIPDFTNGYWKTNARVDLSLKQGANTTVRIR